MKQRKCLPIYLPPDLYERYERASEELEREPVQQTTWLIKQWLAQLEREPAERPLSAA